MAKDFRVTNARAQDALDNLLTSEASEGILRIYSGSLTAGAPTTPAGDLLAELTLNATAFGAASPAGTGVTITAGVITKDSSANAAGDAGCFVLFDSAGTTPLCAGNAGESGDDCVMTLDEKTIAAGAEVSASAFTISLPKGWTTA